MDRAIYLDHAATTPVHPAAVEAMRPYWTEQYGNPASQHSVGRRARRAIDNARERIARLLNAGDAEIVFTSGATEANNLAIFGTPGRVLASPLEHPCVMEPVKQLADRGHTVEYMPADASGRVQLNAIPGGVRLVTLMRVNHETGAIQPLVHSGKHSWHCDAAQAAGKIPLDFLKLGVTTLAISGHKFGGPPGIGALVVRKGAKLSPLLFGGPQQQERRPGTEPVALAVGLATALELAIENMSATAERVQRLNARLLAGLRANGQEIVVNSPSDGSPYILNVSFPGFRGDAVLIALDLEGVAASGGSACASGSVLPSAVLTAMGLPEDVVRGAVRFSFGTTTTEDEIDEAIQRSLRAIERLRRNKTLT